MHISFTVSTKNVAIAKDVEDKLNAILDELQDGDPQLTATLYTNNERCVGQNNMDALAFDPEERW